VSCLRCRANWCTLLRRFSICEQYDDITLIIARRL
jgi:hypothetical protein